MPRARAHAAAPAPSTWAEALDRFDHHLADLERSRHTRSDYREDLEAFADWYEARYQDPPMLATIAPAELREWKRHLHEDRGHEVATVNRRLAAIRSLLRWAEGQGYAPEVRTPKSLRRKNPPPRWLNEKEQRALIRAAEKHGDARVKALILLLMHTGARVEELARATWDDIEMSDRKGTWTIFGKGRKERKVPLNAEARAALEEARKCFRDVRGRDTAQKLFYGQRGGLTERGVQSILAKLRRHTGLDELSPHVLRHTFGHNLAARGVPIQIIADLMGHESLETTRRYVQPGQDDLSAAVEKLAGGED